MINKIGSKRAKWFAVLDHTSGYHQAPIDETMKEMRSFLGLSSQFRDHVKDYATLAKPLHEAITDNKKIVIANKLDA